MPFKEDQKWYALVLGLSDAVFGSFREVNAYQTSLYDRDCVYS